MEDTIMEETNVSSSSSSLPPNKKLKTNILASSVYMSVFKGSESCMEWYVLRTNEQGDDTETTCCKIPILNSRSPDLPMFFGYATIGSLIYLVGGQYRDKSFDVETVYKPACKDVYFFHTISWELKQAPPMQASRAFPVVIPIDTRLYVFGGKGMGISDPWAEFYCSQNEEEKQIGWYSVSAPPRKLWRATPIDGHAVFEEGRKIVFWSRKLFFFYNVVDDTWDLCKTNSCFWSTQFTYINDVLFWYDKGDICAYNLANNTTFDQPIYSFNFLSGKPLEYYEQGVPLPFLVATDKTELYIIWCGSDAFLQLQISFVKLHIEFVGECIVPEYVCSKTFKTTGTEIYCCLGVQPQNGEEHKFCDETDQLPNDENGKAVSRLKFKRTDLRKVKQSNCEVMQSKGGDPQSLMEQLSLVMHDRSRIGDSRIVEKAQAKITSAIEKVSVGERPETNLERKDEITVHDLLQSLGLQKYISIFEENKIEVKDLKGMKDERLRALKIPKGPTMKILHEVNS